MGLGGLDTALSGLRIAQQQLDTIASNVANVGTPGYSRKILPQATVTVEGKSVGVRGMPVTRNVDLYLSRDLWTQVSASDFYSVQAEYLNRIQEFHGPPEAETSVAAQVAQLRDEFAALADSPDDTFLQRAVVDQAAFVADKINDFADLISEMRNDAQRDIALEVQAINDLLGTIADTNMQIRLNKSSNKSTAALEDTRDQAISELSQKMAISSFMRGDGVLVVQTDQGVQLADQNAETVFFQGATLGPTSFYPAAGGGIYIGGNPAQVPTAIEITNTGIGGKLGGLVEIRDITMPRQQAQLDEMAHKLALRFETQGLRLFTDADGNVPDNADPIPNPPGPLTPVEYVGFSSEIRINAAVLADNRLVQQGTVPADVPILDGSNEVIRRVLQFAFSDVQYVQAAGNTDIRAAATGGTTMQDWLGVYSQNSVVSKNNLNVYSDIDSLIDASTSSGAFGTPAPVLTVFELTFEEARTGLGPTTVTIDLLAAQAAYPADNTADQLQQYITDQITLAAVDPALAAAVSVNQYGQLVFSSRGSITISNAVPNGIPAAGMEILGLEAATYPPTDPYIDIQVGNSDPVRVTIEPGDTEVELFDKLDYNGAGNPGVPGLDVDIDPLTGFLTLSPHPGGVDAGGNPIFGGDIRITGGPFVSAGGLSPDAAASDSILNLLFGTDSPVVEVDHAAFRYDQLGQNADISTGVIVSTGIIDFGQKMVNRQTEEVNLAETRQEDAETFRDLLQTRLLNDSGVNIEEELSNLIIMQTAFSAAAKVVTAIDEQFRELLNAI